MIHRLPLILACLLALSSNAYAGRDIASLAEKLGTEDYTLLVNSGWRDSYVPSPDYDAELLARYSGKYRTVVGLVCFDRTEERCREGKSFVVLFLRGQDEPVFAGVSLSEATLDEEDFGVLAARLKDARRGDVHYGDGEILGFHLTLGIGKLTESEKIAMVLLVPAVVLDLVFQIPLLLVEGGGVTVRKAKFKRALSRFEKFIGEGKRHLRSSVKLRVDLDDYQRSLAKPLPAQN
jgi:hypothetical protein